jgi:Raf kinase inhibitor-like YbhB/YbcL family protein
MKLESPVFEDGGEIPERFGYPKQNINPELRISDVPDETASLVLIADDPDALEPAGKIWDHWIAFDIDPEKTVIEEGEPEGTQGENDYEETGYGGPNPPDGEHTYVFRLYALDTELGLAEGVPRTRVEEEMEGHVIEKTELKGRYSPVK